MKTLLYTGLGVLCAQAVSAQIDSRVIHNYNEFGVGYQYVDADGADGHGVTGGGSVDINNILLGGAANYVWFDDADAEAWSVGAFAGYVVRLMDNHLNIIPRVGVSYNEISVDFGGGGSAVENFVGIAPGITGSYAINNQISVNGGYTYTQDIDDDVDVEAHGFSVGTRVAIAESLGLNLNAFFVEDEGFTGVSAILSWHF